MNRKFDDCLTGGAGLRSQCGAEVDAPRAPRALLSRSVNGVITVFTCIILASSYLCCMNRKFDDCLTGGAGLRSQCGAEVDAPRAPRALLSRSVNGVITVFTCIILASSYLCSLN